MVHAQLASGGEYWLREAEAAKKSLETRTLRNNMIYESAAKLNRTPTEADLDQFDSLAKVDPFYDPATVLEEA